MDSSSVRGMRTGRVLAFALPVTLAAITLAAVAVLTIVFVLRPGAGPGPGPSAAAATADTPAPSASVGGSATPGPTPVATATPTATPAPTGDWSGLVWSDPVTPPFTINLLGLQPWDDGYVAVGLAGGRGAFFTSPDGLNWTVTQDVEWDPATAVGRGWRFVAIEDALLAFSPPAASGPYPHETITAPRILRSVDGARWDRLVSQSWDEAWNDRVFLDVTGGPAGMVAIGDAVAGEHGELFADPLVLHSTDGSAWTPTVLTGASAESVVWDALSTPNGYVLLGGAQSGQVIGMGMPQAWWSADGLTWDVATVEGATASDGFFERGVAAADGLVAHNVVLTAGAPVDPAGWWSPDGRSWRRTDDIGIDVPTRFLDGDGARIVAFETEPEYPIGDPDHERALTRAWVTSDGASWAPMTLSHAMTDALEVLWVVPDGVIYAGEQSFWFGAATRE